MPRWSRVPAPPRAPYGEMRSGRFVAGPRDCRRPTAPLHSPSTMTHIVGGRTERTLKPPLRLSGFFQVTCFRLLNQGLRRCGRRKRQWRASRFPIGRELSFAHTKIVQHGCRCCTIFVGLNASSNLNRERRRRDTNIGIRGCRWQLGGPARFAIPAFSPRELRRCLPCSSST